MRDPKPAEAAMRAVDIMTPNPVTVSAHMRIGQAISLMQESDIRHAPVVRDGALVGMLSDRDLRALWVPGSDLGHDGRVYDRRVEDFMSTDPYTVGPETELDEVIDHFIDTRFGAFPVVDADGALVGILSVIDVLKAASGRL
jgi:acetoin utilization protein AcuB